MNKEVRFDIKLTVDGQEVVGKITTSAKQLAQQLGIAKSDSDKLRNSLFLYNGVTQVFDGFTNSVQNVLGVFKDLIAANAEEVVAGAKLANNMRNTMAATDAEVQSIKELCAAQQQLGVIGDEVQLAGAQELATYLTKKQSLEQLIPVMNDMLAQQYGLTASSEQAAQIASMLGKVMDGQVGALSRYGYKFDEAQEQVLKFGTEEQRAAVLTDVVTSAVGGMNAALAQTDAGKAKQMANNMGDLKEKIGALLAPYEELIVKIGNWTMAINQTISVTSSVMGGLKTMRTFLLGIESAAYSCNMAFRAFVVEEKVLGMVSRATGVSLTTLKVAIRGVLIASGVGLAIAALTWALEKLVFSSDEAADGLDGVSDASQRFKDSQREVEEAGQQASAALTLQKSKLEELIKAKNAGQDVSKEETKIIGELNNAYGETMGYFSDVSSWYNALIANSEDYCRQMVLEAKTRRLANQIAEKESEINDIIYDEKGNKKKYSKQRKTQLITTGQIDAGDGKFLPQYESREIAGTSPWEIATEKVKDARGVISNLNKQMQDAVKEVASIQFSVKGSATPPKGGKTGGKTGSGTGSGNTEKTLIENASTYKDLTNNVAYYQQELEKCDVTDKKRIDTLAKAKKATEEVIRAFREMADGNSTAAEGSVDWYETRLRELSKEIRSTGNESVVADLQNDYKAIEEEFKNFKIRVGLEVQEPDELAAPEVTVREAKRQDYDTFSQQASRIQQDYEIGIIGQSEALAEIAELNLALEKLGLNPVEIPVMTEDIDKAKKKFEGATDAVGQMGQSLAGLGSALELPELNIAGTIAQAIATMALGYAKASTTPKDPFTWLAFAATGLAQLTAMIASVKQATAFAQGGIVSGPTMALVGEYAGASNNPEVIAPLDKLRSMIGPQEGISGRVVFKIEGRTLRGVLEREHHHLARS